MNSTMDQLLEVIPEGGLLLRGTPYVLLKLLGKGAHGNAYLAHNPDLDRKEVIKILVNAYHEEIRYRFKFEAQSIASIHHPNVVRIHIIGVLPDGRPFYSMDYIEGEALSKRLRWGHPMPLREALGIAMQIADGLAACHAKNIIHRDLKPGNIVLGSDGSAKIIDFGIAKRATDAAQGQSGWTQGALIGTPQYMSPEQAQGLPQAAEPTTDVYALGAVLYAMLTGKTVYEGNFSEQLGHKLYTPTPTLAAAGTGGVYPPAVEQLSQRLLAKDPKHRIQTAAEVRQEIQRVLRQLPADVRVESSPDAAFDAPTLDAQHHTAVAAAAAASGVVAPPRAYGMRSSEAPTLDPSQASSGRDAPTLEANPLPPYRAPSNPPTLDERARTTVVTAAERSRRRRTPLVLAVAALFVAGGGIGAWLVTRTHNETVVPSPTVSAQPSVVPQMTEVPKPEPKPELVAPTPSESPPPPLPPSSAKTSAPKTEAPSAQQSKPGSKTGKTSTQPVVSSKPTASSPPPVATTAAPPPPPPKGAMDDPF